MTTPNVSPNAHTGASMGPLMQRPRLPCFPPGLLPCALPLRIKVGKRSLLHDDDGEATG